MYNTVLELSKVNQSEYEPLKVKKGIGCFGPLPELKLVMPPFRYGILEVTVLVIDTRFL